MTAAVTTVMTAAVTAVMTAVITGSISPTLQNKICSVLFVDSSRFVNSCNDSLNGSCNGNCNYFPNPKLFRYIFRSSVMAFCPDIICRYQKNIFEAPVPVLVLVLVLVPVK